MLYGHDTVQSMLLYLKWEALYRKSTLLPHIPDLLLCPSLVQVRTNNNGPKRHIVGKDYTLLNILFKKSISYISRVLCLVNICKYLQESSLGFHCFVFLLLVVVVVVVVFCLFWFGFQLSCFVLF